MKTYTINSETFRQHRKARFSSTQEMASLLKKQGLSVSSIKRMEIFEGPYKQQTIAGACKVIGIDPDQIVTCGKQFQEVDPDVIINADGEIAFLQMFSSKCIPEKIEEGLPIKLLIDVPSDYFIPETAKDNIKLLFKLITSIHRPSVLTSGLVSLCDDFDLLVQEHNLKISTSKKIDDIINKLQNNSKLSVFANFELCDSSGDFGLLVINNKEQNNQFISVRVFQGDQPCPF